MADSFIFRLSNEKHRPNFTPLPVYCFTYPPHKFLCHFFLALLILSGSHSFSKKNTGMFDIFCDGGCHALQNLQNILKAQKH